MALNNFFKTENILQLRELALKEVALRVEKKVENEVVASVGIRHERFMACISSHEKSPRRIIRKVARLATVIIPLSLHFMCRLRVRVWIELI